MSAQEFPLTPTLLTPCVRFVQHQSSIFSSGFRDDFKHMFHQEVGISTSALLPLASAGGGCAALDVFCLYPIKRRAFSSVTPE